MNRGPPPAGILPGSFAIQFVSKSVIHFLIIGGWDEKPSGATSTSFVLVLLDENHPASLLSTLARASKALTPGSLCLVPPTLTCRVDHVSTPEDLLRGCRAPEGGGPLWTSHPSAWCNMRLDLVIRAMHRVLLRSFRVLVIFTDAGTES